MHRLAFFAWLPRLVATVAACLAIYCAVELVDLSNVAGGPPLSRYPLRLPAALVLVMPVALLLSACWTGVHLARSGQLLALAAAGLDPRRSMAALPLVAALLGGGVFLLADHVSPRALERWSDGAGAPGAENRWVASGDTLYRLGPRSGDGYSDVVAITLDERGLPRTRVEAEGASPAGGEGGWTLTGAMVARAGEPPSTRLDSIPAPAAVPAPSVEGAPQHMTRERLGVAITGARRAGLDPAPLEAEGGLRLAISVCCPLCMILGLVAGARLGRRPGVAAAVATGAAVVTWLLIAVAWGLSASDMLPGGAVPGLPVAVLGPAAATVWCVALR